MVPDVAGQGAAGPGMAGRGEVRGQAGQGLAGRGGAWFAAWLGQAGLGSAWQGKARHGSRLGAAWHGRARLGTAWFGAWRGAAGQGRARRGKAWFVARYDEPEQFGGRGQTRWDNSPERSVRMERYEVELTGVTDLLMHQDDLMWAAEMKKWEADSENKKSSTAGDDRSPAFRWLGNAYHDARYIGIPSDNIMTCIREGATRVPVRGKGKLTFKKMSQSGIIVDQILWPVGTAASNGNPISWVGCKVLLREEDFFKHEQTVKELGFELFVKGAGVNRKRHIRVRPRFTNWTCAGTLTVMEEMITQEVLQDILTAAGNYCGIGDWRPSSPQRSGFYGRFLAEVKKI